MKNSRRNIKSYFFVKLFQAQAATFEIDPGYGSRVEFAKKLGYTEKQVRTALSKLGPSPSQNELLSELIQLDSSNASTNMTENDDDESLKGGSTTGSSTHGRSADPSSLRHIVIDGSNVAMR
jgi:ribonuclease ZC3H12